jgi:hypothetical protein
LTAWVGVIRLPPPSKTRPANKLGASAPTANERSCRLAASLSLGHSRYYWLARDIPGAHNPTWSRAKLISLVKWFTKHGQKAGDDVFIKWGKWLLGTHRNGKWDHMKPEYRHRLPEIEARYQEWMAKLGG